MIHLFTQQFFILIALCELSCVLMISDIQIFTNREANSAKNKRTAFFTLREFNFLRSDSSLDMDNKHQYLW